VCVVVVGGWAVHISVAKSDQLLTATAADKLLGGNTIRKAVQIRSTTHQTADLPVRAAALLAAGVGGDALGSGGIAILGCRAVATKLGRTTWYHIATAVVFITTHTPRLARSGGGAAAF